MQKVVTSTLAAKSVSLASALDQLGWLRLFWKWIHNPQTDWKHSGKALLEIEPTISVPTLAEHADVAITNCKSLYDSVTRTAPPSCSEFRVRLTARAIKEALREGVDLQWVHSGAQLADSLTKPMETSFLRATLRLGCYKLHDESAMLRERAHTRDRIKWLRQGLPERDVS